MYLIVFILIFKLFTGFVRFALNRGDQLLQSERIVLAQREPDRAQCEQNTLDRFLGQIRRESGQNFIDEIVLEYLE